MKRLWILCALLTTTTMVGHALAGSSAQPRAVRGVSAQRDSRAVVQASRSRAQTFLFGARSVARHRDSASAGRARSFAFENHTAGVVRGLRIYLDSHTRARRVVVGLYSNHRGHPGSLLARGTVSKPRHRAWNRATVRSTKVHAGWTYWLAVLGHGGRVTFRDRSGKRCLSATSRRSIATLPSLWRTQRTSATCHVSAYAIGTRTSTGTSRPSPTPPAKPAPPAPPSAPRRLAAAVRCRAP